MFFRTFIVFKIKFAFLQALRLKIFFSDLSLLPLAALKHSPSKRKSLSRVAQQRSTESEADSHGKL